MRLKIKGSGLQKGVEYLQALGWLAFATSSILMNCKSHNWTFESREDIGVHLEQSGWSLRMPFLTVSGLAIHVCFSNSLSAVMGS